MKIKLENIKFNPRLRVDNGDVETLAASIQRLGLLQPIVLEEGTNLLIAGGRRLAACISLGWDEIPCVYASQADKVTNLMRELEENTNRKDMTWQERCLAIAEADHQMRYAHYAEGQEWTQAHTGALLGFVQAHVSTSLLVASHLRKNDAEIVKAESMAEALRILVKRREVEAAKVLAAKLTSTPILSSAVVTPKETPIPPTEPPKPGEPARVAISQLYTLGDALAYMRGCPAGAVDHIVTDPPYGINMENLAQDNLSISNIDLVKEEHQVEPNKQLVLDFIAEAFRVVNDKGFCVFWYDMDHHNTFLNHAVAVGWNAQRWPLFWVKTSPCLNQCSSYNFTKSVEACMVLRKPKAMLVKPGPANYYLSGLEDVKDKFNHPFAKPVGLWKWIYEHITYKGQIVLDPFAGSCTSVIAALESHLRPLAVESNPRHHSVGTEALRLYFRNVTNNNVIFV